ncbi:MAG: Gx transporter family protein [Firmicutes bacterium]|nr:Gx transporter family protein [Bacillota bacterium]MCL1953392.1 Gx transporter family protein [Bacillota bacterium]
MKKQYNITKRTVRIALFVALALVMYMVESLVPPVFAFAPGAKLGLANVVSLCALVLLGIVDSYLVVVLRCILAMFLVGNPTALMYSLPSSIFALSSMVLLYCFIFPKVSLMGISFLSAIVFNIVQLLVASWVVGNIYVVLYLPLMFLASAGAGLFVGLLSFFVIKHTPSNVYL